MGVRERAGRELMKQDERIAELEQENAKLREEFDKMDVWHSKELTATMAENAKLRELVRELYHELDAATQYDAGGGRGVMSEFAGRMRELGVDA